MKPQWKTDPAGRKFEDVRYEKWDGIAKITINRPEVRNAFRPQTLFELQAAFTEAREDPKVGVVILTGEGDHAFCSGGDQRVRGAEGYVGADGVPRLNVLDLQKQIRSLPKPVVAMVAGFAIGGGHVLHLVCDLSKNIYLEGGKPFEVVALTDSAALLLAWGNDTDFSNVFAGQARTWLRAGDVLLAISGSGNSPNVLAAVKVGCEVGATTIGLCGYSGGKLAEMTDLAVVARRDNMQQVEDVHMVLGHVLFSALRDRIHGRLTA